MYKRTAKLMLPRQKKINPNFNINYQEAMYDSLFTQPPESDFNLFEFQEFPIDTFTAPLIFDEPFTLAPSDDSFTSTPSDDSFTSTPSDDSFTSTPSDDSFTFAPSDDSFTFAPSDDS